jgi:hypothetical protein
MTNNTIPNAISYHSLDTGCIRLLSILKIGDESLYDLSHVALNDEPSFTALPYTWDDQRQEHDLLLKKSTLKVIKNVRTMLPYLARNAIGEQFWIDRICI